MKKFFSWKCSGSKTDAIKTGNRIFFIESEDFGTIATTISADIGTAYTSVMVFGQIKVLDAGEIPFILGNTHISLKITEVFFY